MMRKHFWLVFALVFAWKIALFIFTAQPIPANDAFFYDGAVIHYQLHSGYYNPSLGLAFPISGHQLFSAYPPLYQAALLGWTSFTGTSARSVMLLHLCLFGLYLFVLLAICRRLKIPAWCINLAGGFLLILTFHDRPDSLAHLLGMLGVYCCIRSRKIFNDNSAQSAGQWTWLMAILIVLTLATSLQIGGIYFLVICIGTILACRFSHEPMPWLPFSFMALAPIALVLLVKVTLPQAWAGFIEHISQTPTITGLRLPRTGELLKIIRTVPGILLITVLMLRSWRKWRSKFAVENTRRELIVLLAALLPALAMIAASLFIISPNDVGISAYLQPLIVACYLGLVCPAAQEPFRPRCLFCGLLFAILLGSVRAIGMTTWGVACAADVSYSTAVQRVEQDLANRPPGYKVVMSSAFLYDAASHDKLELIHSDWLSPAKGPLSKSDADGLLAFKPNQIILTQYDYYRRYKRALDNLSPSDVAIKIENSAKTQPPDAFPKLQQVVQHISWAPIIVTLDWRK